MKTCKTCVYWVTFPRDIDGAACECPHLCESMDRDRSRTDQLVYCYDEGGAFYPGPDFGCVHHKEKP